MFPNLQYTVSKEHVISPNAFIHIYADNQWSRTFRWTANVNKQHDVFYMFFVSLYKENPNGEVFPITSFMSFELFSKDVIKK